MTITYAKSLYTTTFTSTFDGGEVAMADASDRNVVKTAAEKTRKTSDALGMTGMLLSSVFCDLGCAGYLDSISTPRFPPLMISPLYMTRGGGVRAEEWKRGRVGTRKDISRS